MTLLARLGYAGPPPNFFLGNLMELFSKGTVVCFSQWQQKYGDTFGFYMGGTYHIFITDTRLLKKIQISNFHLFTMRNKVVKGGLLPTSVGQDHIIFTENWKRQR